jgi:hypothetical protein
VTKRRVSLNNSEMIFGVTMLAEQENADENKIACKTLGVEQPGKKSI